MSDESKQNIDELLSDYVDGELSKRKYNELKRLMEHDPELAEKFSQLEKQRQLLNAMPVETAPEGLFDAVIASQERKFILNEYSAASGESEGIKHLMFRRALTAAVIFVLFGGLIGLIAHIVAPVEQTEPQNYAADNGGQEDTLLPPLNNIDVPVAAADTPVFRASLDLRTEQAIAMNSYIMKSIFTHDLNGFTDPPENKGTSSTIRITCGIDSIVELLADLESEWDKCREANLSVYDHALAKEIVIEKISSTQLLRIFKEDKFYTRMQISRDYADFNKLNPYGSVRLASNDTETDTTAGAAVKPELTSSKLDRKDRLEGGEKISLVITVTGL
ncbi:MAG: hypothetical protein K9M75_08020 [Phycisphaerae bacterium]|nr:hypothetical protein [Phycisphaerae bacterium]